LAQTNPINKLARNWSITLEKTQQKTSKKEAKQKSKKPKKEI
jgi:hypothetical protein